MVKVKRLIHTTILIESKDAIIYIDPYKLPADCKKADIILISHEHFDHLSVSDIEKVLKHDTKIFVPNSVIPKVLQFTNNETIGFDLHEKIEVKGIKIEIVPAYNTDKPFHKEDTDWAGFVLTIEGKRIYYAGDTDLIPEMNLVLDIDLAILPIAGEQVMDAEEAASATAIIMPEKAMPTHYGDFMGTEEDVKIFKNKAHCDVVIDEVEL